MTTRTLNEQVDSIAAFGLSVLLLGLIARMMRDATASAFDSGKLPLADPPGILPTVRLEGIGRRPPRPGEAMEREEEKLERWKRGMRPGAPIEPLVTEEEIRQIHELRSRGLQFKEIARRMNRPQPTVYAAWRRGLRTPKKRQITTERILQAIRLRQQGLTLSQIGERMGGVTKSFVYHVLHQGGQRIDPREAAEELYARLKAVGDLLQPPVDAARLENAADRLVDIYEDAALLVEIMPYVPMISVPQPGDIGFWAVLAEEVLRSGVWCLEQRLRGDESKEVHVSDRTREVKVPLTGKKRELLGSCGEAAMDAARGIIQQRPGYETKSAQILYLLDEMMGEAEE